MAKLPEDSPRSRLALLKLLYLLAVTAAAFGVPAIEATRPAEWYVVSGLLTLQVATLLACGIGLPIILGAGWRLKWFFVFLLACYAFLPDEGKSSNEVLRSWQVPGIGWTVPLNLPGLEHAALMCLQLLTVILVSAVVRLTGSGTDLADGLRAFGLPGLFVHSLDQTLSLLGGRGREQPVEREATGQKAPSLFHMLGRLFRGDVGLFVESIQRNLNDAQKQVARQSAGWLDSRLIHDVSVIAGVALAMVSLKIIKILPGIPFAPGFKVLLLFPLYITASQRTFSRWGGTVAGSIMGVIGFLQGDGRYGVLEILKHAAPGLVIDLARPLIRRLPQSAIVYCVLGFVAAIARTSAEFAAVLFLGARAEIYLFPAARLIPILIAGTLSGFVTLFVLRAFQQGKPVAEQASAEVSGLIRARNASDGKEAAGVAHASGSDQAALPSP
jgi:hypothetical protein